jgi:hypothetical protein
MKEFKKFLKLNEPVLLLILQIGLVTPMLLKQGGCDGLLIFNLLFCIFFSLVFGQFFKVKGTITKIESKWVGLRMGGVRNFFTVKLLNGKEKTVLELNGFENEGEAKIGNKWSGLITAAEYLNIG